MGELTLMWESCCFDSTNSVIRKQTRDVGFVGSSLCGGSGYQIAVGVALK